MNLIKCPRCELNYMLDTDRMCSVCRRDVRGESEQYEMVELCSECGENPVVPGHELCAYCLKEMAQREADTQENEDVVSDAASIGIDSVSTMEEIELDLSEDIDGEVFDDSDREFFNDEDEDESSRAKGASDEDR